MNRYNDCRRYDDCDYRNDIGECPDDCNQFKHKDDVLVVRCCDCNNRNDEDKCPMCNLEYKPMIDYKTDDNGFCYKWERRTDDEQIY